MGVGLLTWPKNIIDCNFLGGKYSVGTLWIAYKVDLNWDYFKSYKIHQ